MRKLGHVTLLVNDYDEAMDFYVQRIGFALLADNDFGEGMRWVAVAPPKSEGSALVFVKADTENKKARVGSQAGEHVFLVVETEDCLRDYARMKANGVKFMSEPKHMPWGIEVEFEDLYGNQIDLLQPNGH